MTNPLPEHNEPTRAARPSVPKTTAFVIAILLVQLGFILSYVGAFHAPTASAIQLQVVAPTDLQGRIVDELNAIGGKPLAARAAATSASALAQLRSGHISGIFTINTTGTTDRLTIATAGGASVATAVTTIIQEVDASQHRTVFVKDAVPVQAGDGRGLTGFYMVTGWLIGGYLLAAVLGILLGTTLSGARQALTRIAIFVPYALVAGIGGTLIVDQGLGAVTGHFWSMAAVGALVVMAGAMVTVGLQSFLGIVGIGVSIVLFVVLGNPSAGGAYQQQLLPPFWRAISPWIPNGAATSSLRNIVYFHANDIAGSLAVVAGYALVGVLLVFLAAVLNAKRDRNRIGQV